MIDWNDDATKAPFDVELLVARDYGDGSFEYLVCERRQLPWFPGRENTIWVSGEDRGFHDNEVNYWAYIDPPAKK